MWRNLSVAFATGGIYSGQIKHGKVLAKYLEFVLLPQTIAKRSSIMYLFPGRWRL